MSRLILTISLVLILSCLQLVIFCPSFVVMNVKLAYGVCSGDVRCGQVGAGDHVVLLVVLVATASLSLVVGPAPAVRLSGS